MCKSAWNPYEKDFDEACPSVSLEDCEMKQESLLDHALRSLVVSYIAMIE